MNLIYVLPNIIIVILLLFFIPYIKKKGEGLASKQDIAKITNEVEKVRIGYSLLLEEVKAQNQFRLSIFPEQIKKYQEAFTLSIKLLHSIYDPTELPKAIKNCQDWFNENLVYLDEEAQKVFKDAYLSANMHPTFLRSDTLK
jgi:hypothetical protein